ncbi:MAG: Undecaprenyl-diphosphatase [candidate division Kazan bacterium GW2011_GWC1_52_13]|uniref:Undecaprenyl-diphosphatase n=2 Tax=Bacteria division Kazan-3B-28 TaxID=1798534 RepID=A0A0G1X8M8_UNCK3|nr:MAG: Undecaprenyl-diphosphatase [candidate division Kazan bacterium GW2011_GWC1_52_13]KKW27145.1 MAG: Undecaprenyl-diphosphatase [candidate division Kazan bacterium GW2011_GWB1_52_7]
MVRTSVRLDDYGTIGPMSQYLQAAILGLVQGITEFVPISSSGHLVVVRQVFNWADQGLAFDAVLHLATLAAVLFYFRHDWLKMVEAVVTKKQTYELRQARKLAGLIAVTTIPAIGAGLLFAGTIESTVRHLHDIAILMVGVGLLFFVAERYTHPRRDVSKLNFFDGLSIGLAQAVAIVPGISRSGATIITGMYHGLSRESAARYSFLAAGPIIALAGFYSLWQLFRGGISDGLGLELAIGFVVSFSSGLLAIHWLLKFLNKHPLNIFAWYRIVVGAGLLIFSWLK